MFECKHQKSCGEFEKSINKSSSLVSDQNMKANKLTHITYVNLEAPADHLVEYLDLTGIR